MHRDDYDLAHVDVYSGPAFGWAEAVCFELRRLGKPYVLTLHGGNLPAFARRWPRRVRHLLRSAATVTTPSRFLAEQISAHADEVVLLPNAVDLASFEFRARRGAAPRLVWLRALHGLYNPVLAVEVLARVRQRLPAAMLTMVGADKGDGALAAVEARARELGVTDRLQLVGGVPRSEVPRHLNTGDIFLNTTDADNSPVSVLEAMACGLCVVSTSVGGIPYMLTHEHDALLVPPRDAAAMADAVVRIANDRQLALRLSTAAREYAATRDWSSIIDRWEHLFREVVTSA